MVIKNNLLAMNSTRMNGINTLQLKKSTERLSSGYKINRAADDAAGLTISETMRVQIRGLNQASDNVKDGISLIQVADGAMSEIHDILQRCNELSVKASNGTLTMGDRQAVQKEIKNLTEEIDRIADSTTFNEMHVLKGGQTPLNNTVTITGSMPSWVNGGPSIPQGFMAEEYITTETYLETDTVGNTTVNSVNIPHKATRLDFSSFNGSARQVNELLASGFYTTCCTCDNHYSIKFVDEATSSLSKSGNHFIYNIGINGVTNTNDLLDRIIRGTSNGYPNSHYTKLAADRANGTLIIYDDRSNAANPTLGSQNTIIWQNWSNPGFNVNAGSNAGKFGFGVATAKNDPLTPSSIEIQAGPRASHHIPIVLPSISSDSLGINNANVLTQPNAQNAIGAFNDAISIVSEHRSRMGAYQNRLEHTMLNLDNIAENTQAAESLIRDTSMAEEMLSFSKFNILLRCGQSIMAQANQMPNSVLSLLK